MLWIQYLLVVCGRESDAMETWGSDMELSMANAKAI